MKNMVEFKTEHYGDYKHNCEEHGYNAIVISGPIMGSRDVRFGRLIQVRKKSGAFGSDTILIREPNGTLSSHHNQAFFSVADEFKPNYEKAMKKQDALGHDKKGDEYSIQGHNPASGFVVEGLDDTDGKTYAMAMTIKTTEND